MYIKVGNLVGILDNIDVCGEVDFVFFCVLIMFYCVDSVDLFVLVFVNICG